ncbi:TonB-dependent receptor [Croceicoccus bisphenolivorans]|uniref:TonB-dependent receptor n=1 Tax=Croceicoccus bisphenolivorans TaxID=1783232 RepID=UPI000B1007AB|nr:TonB-dependent receptor [Croceicoccus bisphenolivorans]
MKTHFLRGVCCATFLQIMSAQAYAQTSDQGSEQDARPADGGIAEIVVTASRRAESAQRAAVSIQAIDANTLATKGVFGPEGLNAIAPGVTLGTAGNYPQTYVRGVGNFAANSFAEGAVATNIDGVYVSRPWGVRGAFFDLERIEVLKGPQGTLYGRNASGGALNIITVRPKLGEVSGFGEVEVGNYEMRRASAALNVPLGQTVAARVSGQIIDRDGYLSDGADDEESQAARLQILFDSGSDVRLLLRGVYQHVGGVGAGGVVVDPDLSGDGWTQNSDPSVAEVYAAEPEIGPLLVTPGTDSFLDLTSVEIGAELEWDLGPATLTIIPSHRDSKYSDLSYVPGYRVRDTEHAKQTSVEARFSNESDRLKWVLGAFWFDERQTPKGDAANLTVNFGPGSIAIGPPFRLATESIAAFGQATFSVTDVFRLTGGLRYTHETKDFYQQSFRYGFSPDGTCSEPDVAIENPPFPGQFCQFSFTQDDSAKFNNVSWKVGAEYDVGPASLAYGSISTGFKSGGFFPSNIPGVGRFDPEKLTAFEIGLKNRFLDNRLQFNVEAFHWIYKDQQTSALLPLASGYVTQATFNAGRAKITGGDVDIVAKLSDADTINAKVEYIHTKYDEFQFTQYAPATYGCSTTTESLPRVVDCSGNPLIRTPKWSGTAGYSHVFDLGGSGTLDASVDTQFASKAYMGFDYAVGQIQDAYAIVNASLTYRDAGDAISVTAYVRNIGNEAVMSQAFRHAFISGNNPLTGPDGLITATMRPPRTYGVIVRAGF